MLQTENKQRLWLPNAVFPQRTKWIKLQIKITNQRYSCYFDLKQNIKKPD